MLRYSILLEHWDMYLQGFANTLKASVLALIGSLVIGIIIAIFRIAPIHPLNWIGTIYVEFIRNIPLILIVFVFFVGFPAIGIRFDSFTAGTLGLMVYTAAFIAEVIRSGILAVPKGQMEAARSSGLTYIQTLWYIILPQALRRMVPPIVSQFISLLKDTSLAIVISLPELMNHAQIINGRNVNYVIPIFILVALMYFVVNYSLSLVSRRLEYRQR
ncbi:amino acid ABC transporter permease [Geobacillus sp. E263]|uniref:amino acid ABC transporter permease n=1 Tax=Geobacillus sp. E263 TaxID=391290 RepID=UPI00117A1F94|nr:amino acid ABC transporter permease [Geobacillus sp. E263]